MKQPMRRLKISRTTMPFVHDADADGDEIDAEGAADDAAVADDGFDGVAGRTIRRRF